MAEAHDSLVAQEGGVVKVSVTLTKWLLQRIQDLQAREGTQNLSHWLRNFLRTHLPGPTSQKVNRKVGDEVEELVTRVAQEMGTDPESLVRTILIEHLPAYWERAVVARRALEELRQKLTRD